MAITQFYIRDNGIGISVNARNFGVTGDAVRARETAVDADFFIPSGRRRRHVSEVQLPAEGRGKSADVGSRMTDKRILALSPV